MKVQVRYFASLREALGTSESVEVPGGTTVQALREQLAARDAAHAAALAGGRAVRAAVNHVMCIDTALVPDGAEVAFFPPVTGG